jgi:photosystem II stability/assembly factor-like uncharacterized protein
MRGPLLVLSVLCLVGCSDIDGTEAGKPCNPNGVCVPGLVCEEGRCKAESEVSWEPMKRPLTTDLNAVWGTDANNVFAVGESGVILRYQGQGLDWVDTKQASATGLDKTLTAIWGKPGSIWAVGYHGIVQWNGSSWSKQDAYDAEGTSSTKLSLTAVHGAGNQVYAVGSETNQGRHVLRFNSSTQVWDDVPGADLSFNPVDLWVTDAGEIFVIGADASHVKHFDGSSWSEQNLDGSTKLRAIWGTADGKRLFGVGARGVLATYDGSAWTVNEQGRLDFEAYDIWGLGANDLFVVGSSGSYSSSPGAIERCAVVCSQNPLPADAEKPPFRSVWVAPDGSTVYVVGDDGVILRRKLN